jgi:hypothetical protein
MSDFQAIADRVEIEALRGEFTDAAMTRDRPAWRRCSRRTAPGCRELILGTLAAAAASARRKTGARLPRVKWLDG